LLCDVIICLPEKATTTSRRKGARCRAPPRCICRKMQSLLRIASFVTPRRPFLLQVSPVSSPASSLSRTKQLCTRLSSTGSKSAAKNQVKNGGNTALKNQFSSIHPLPTSPPRPKGTPPIIGTDDIEQYVQPLYARGWGLCPILPNGNGIAVLRKRFEFGSAEVLRGFLADLSKYEEKNQVRLTFFFH